MIFVLDIMQVTFVTVPIVVLPTASFSSQGKGTQAKTSNVTKQITQHSSLQVFGDGGRMVVQETILN